MTSSPWVCRGTDNQINNGWGLTSLGNLPLAGRTDKKRPGGYDPADLPDGRPRLKRPRENILERITARDIMSTDLITVAPGCSLQKSLDLLLEFGIGCLPVVSEGGLVGIVTKTDLQLVLQLLLQTLHVSRSASPVPSVG